MGIYRNIIVEVPDGAYVEKDATVFVKDKNEYDRTKQYNHVKHTIIGKSIGNGRMYPNHNFRLRYPSIFEEVSGAKLPRQTKRIGFYATVLSLVEKTGLYDALIKSYGIENANMAIDFSMYSIIHHSCVADQYPAVMEDQLLFSNSLWNGTKLSKYFNNEITAERTAVFRKIWAQKCNERDITEAWIAIDGTNNDCEAQEVEIAELGKAKSNKNVNIVSYMYAVDSKNGDPITFAIYRGGRVDCKAVIEMVGWLTAYDIKVKGVIVDRGFATKDVLELFDTNGIEYVAMLKADTRAHIVMLEQYASKIRMQYEYMLGRYNGKGSEFVAKEFTTDTKVLYGTGAIERITLFHAHDYKAYVSLIYDNVNGGERQETWFKKVSNAALKIQRQLTLGRNTSVPKEYADCISIEKVDGEMVALVKGKQVQERGERKGFYTLASSVALDAETVNAIYALRNTSEEQFSMVKRQLGYDTTGVRYTNGVRAKLTLAFIATIIRNELVKACQKSELSSNRMINELNHICMHMKGKDAYFVCHTENQRQKSFMEACGVLVTDLDRIAEDENKRLASIEPDPHHHYPRHLGSEKPARKGSGRPPGSKNKKTLATKTLVVESSGKKKPGRPKGSRNRPKADIEAPKRKRGRPRKHFDQD